MDDYIRGEIARKKRSKEKTEGKKFSNKKTKKFFKAEEQLAKGTPRTQHSE